LGRRGHENSSRRLTFSLSHFRRAQKVSHRYGYRPAPHLSDGDFSLFFAAPKDDAVVHFNPLDLQR